jgi:integrase/recombinase XerD
MSDNVQKKRRLPAKDRLRFALPHVEGFKHWLERRGHTRKTLIGLVQYLAHWTDWVHKAGFTLDTIYAGYDASAAAFKGKRPHQEWLNAGVLFIRYLQEQELVPLRPKPASPTQIWPILGAFQDWMRTHRGMAQSSLDTYQTILVDLLQALGDDVQAYTPQAIRGFVLDRASSHGLARAKSVAGAARAFLRYLVATGQCPTGREDAVPGFAGWQLTSVPDFLSPEEIGRVVVACAGEDRLRDRAVILLLARLGLRASEVANLQFRHVDWRNGRIAIAGKSRREEWLPLTQEVGDALIAYIERARPRMATPRVFITAVTPARPMTRTCVKHIVRRALARAGVKSARQGAHLLRHSAATQMLRHGVSLAGVGAVLRHRSPTMTLHYAKVDFALLAEIAQPWAGRPAC